jgi:hypothetical protein
MPLLCILKFPKKKKKKNKKKKKQKKKKKKKSPPNKIYIATQFELSQIGILATKIVIRLISL